MPKPNNNYTNARDLLYLAERAVLQAARDLVSSSKDTTNAAEAMTEGAALIEAVERLDHFLPKMTDAALYTVREGQKRGKGRYLHKKTEDIFAKWTKVKKDRALYDYYHEAEDDAALHGGRVVRLVPRGR